LIRIDPVTMILGVRINNWTDGIIFLGAIAVFILLMKRFPGSVDEPLAGMGEKWRAKKTDPVQSAEETEQSAEETAELTENVAESAEETAESGEKEATT